MSGITQNWRCWCSCLVVVSVLIASLQDSVFAQITPDSTLPNNSSVTRNGNIFNITGGTQASGNLFHSFSEFSVRAGETASFNNAVDIQNIISRVTGGSASNINGLIRALGTANLFLINPNGIIFGRGARLNIGGSFVATTADAIGFGDRGLFNATNPNTPALLTVNPSAFFFNQIAAVPRIQNNSVVGLSVPNGRSLLLLGGNVSMDGGRINAYGGRVELGGLARPGTVGIEVNGNNLSLGFPTESTRADVSLTNRASVNVAAAAGGSIAVNARNLDILGGSTLNAGIYQGLGSVGAVAGDITLDATGEIKVAGSNVFNNVQSRAVGKGGNIDITTASLSVTDGARLSASTAGQGDGGSVTINAHDQVSFDAGQAFSSVESQDAVTTTTPKRIVEATGATLNAKGQIVLSANSSTVSPHTSRQNPVQCHGC